MNKERDINRRKWKALSIPRDDILAMMQQATASFTLPDDVIVQDVMHDWETDSFRFKINSNEYPEHDLMETPEVIHAERPTAIAW